MNILKNTLILLLLLGSLSCEKRNTGLQSGILFKNKSEIQKQYDYLSDIIGKDDLIELEIRPSLELWHNYRWGQGFIEKNIREDDEEYKFFVLHKPKLSTRDFCYTIMMALCREKVADWKVYLTEKQHSIFFKDLNGDGVEDIGFYLHSDENKMKNMVSNNIDYKYIFSKGKIKEERKCRTIILVEKLIPFKEAEVKLCGVPKRVKENYIFTFDIIIKGKKTTLTYLTANLEKIVVEFEDAKYHIFKETVDMKNETFLKVKCYAVIMNSTKNHCPFRIYFGR